VTSLLRHKRRLHVSLGSSKAINLLNTATEGVKLLLLGIKGFYNIFSECIFGRHEIMQDKFHFRDKMAILVSTISDPPS